MKRARVLLLVLLMLGLVLMINGCKLTGGGWLPSATGEGKANFGFNAEIADDTYEFVKGNLVYHDVPADVRAVCDVTGVCDGVAADENFEPCGALLEGTYKPQGKYEDGEEGTFAAWVIDYEGPLDDTGDSIEIWFTGGRYDGYHNGMAWTPLGGGNITYHVTADE